MAKHKVPQYIKDRRLEERAQKRRQKQARLGEKASPSLGKRVLAVLGFAGLILGLAQGIGWLLPEVSVEQETPLSNDPLSAPFVLHNSGHFAIRDIVFGCKITSRIDGRGNRETNDSWVGYMPTIPVLLAGEFTTARCQSAVDFSEDTSATADVTLIAIYKPSFVWWIRRTKNFRFKTVLQSDGKTRWEHVANSAPS